MTDQEINVVCMELDGAIWMKGPNAGEYCRSLVIPFDRHRYNNEMWIPTDEMNLPVNWEGVCRPSYTRLRDLIIPLLSKQTTDVIISFTRELGLILSRDANKKTISCIANETSESAICCIVGGYIVGSTPRQLCEAFLKSVGKWQE